MISIWEPRLFHWSNKMQVHLYLMRIIVKVAKRFLFKYLVLRVGRGQCNVKETQCMQKEGNMIPGLDSASKSLANVTKIFPWQLTGTKHLPIGECCPYNLDLLWQLWSHPFLLIKYDIVRSIKFAFTKFSSQILKLKHDVFQLHGTILCFYEPTK